MILRKKEEEVREDECGRKETGSYPLGSSRVPRDGTDPRSTEVTKKEGAPGSVRR